MNEKDAEKRVNDEKTKFYASKYEGELPKNLFDDFKSALYCLAPNSHGISAVSLRKILGTNKSELTFLEVGLVVNIIVNVPWNYLYPDLETALDKHEIYSDIQKSYNELVAKNDERLRRMHKTLLSLAGSSKENRPSGMVIVQK